jgi:hypothetical protein
LADMFVPRSALEVGALCFLSMFSLHLCSSAGDPQFHLPLYALFDSEVSILYQNVSIALLHTSLAVGHRKRPYFKGVILEFEVIFRIRYWNLEYGRNLLCFVKKNKKKVCAWEIGARFVCGGPIGVADKPIRCWGRQPLRPSLPACMQKDGQAHGVRPTRSYYPISISLRRR